MADERMKLSDLLKNGASDKEILDSIVKSSDSVESKLKALDVLKAGYKVNDTTTRQINVNIADYLTAILGTTSKEQAIDNMHKIKEEHIAHIANVFANGRQDLQEYLNKMLDISVTKSATYETASGTGNNLEGNIDKFRDKLQAMRVAHAKYPNEMYSLIEEEISFVIVNNVLTGDMASDLLKEVFPEKSEIILARVRANMTGEYGKGGMSESLAAAVAGSGGMNTNSEQNSESTKYNTNPAIDAIYANNYDPNNKITKSFVTDTAKMGSSRSKEISYGGTVITDRRAGFRQQLLEIMSERDIDNFINRLFEEYSTQNSQNEADVMGNDTNEVVSSTIESSLNRMYKGDEVLSETEGNNKTVQPTNQGRISSEDKVDSKYSIPDKDYIAMGRAVGAILSNPNGPKTLMEILSDIDNMKEFTDAARIEKYSSIKNRDEKQGGNYSEEFKVLFVWAKKVPATEFAELLESNQLFIQHEQETRNNESYESNMAAAKADMEETMDGMQKIFRSGNNGTN
ncbi:MAG: hypothetical protein IJW28_01715 [Clostridia bacterium]|nr:hypothetical protein [Clostridia bacterium]